MKPTVYIAGPIMGCTHTEANDWRNNLIDLLADFDIVGVSPLRCEPLIGERYTAQYADPRFGTARAIASKNKLDVSMCDMTLCYFPDGMPLSKGTLIELAWANALGKPTILVTKETSIKDHPVVQAASSWIVDTLDEAYDIITGVLGIYTRR